MGLLRAQRTEEPAPPPPPAGPWSTSRAPLLHSLFQGPRFMTSEYNSKYLKEPSHQLGRQSSSYRPTTHPYPQPLGRGSLGTPELAQHYEAISRKQKDIQAAWGNHLPQPDLNALGLPISKGQLTCLGWLIEACPSSALLVCSLSWTLEPPPVPMILVAQASRSLELAPSPPLGP